MRLRRWRSEDVPDEVALAYGKSLTFGRDYITFRLRLIRG